MNLDIIMERPIKDKRIRFLLLALTALALACIFSLGIHYWPGGKDQLFIEVPIEIHDYDLNDLGVVDANQDQYLDLFTTNHSAQQSLLMGRESGNFTDVFLETGLGQDRGFPGLENSNWEPANYPDGLSIYRQNDTLHLVYKSSNPNPRLPIIEGTLRLESGIELLNSQLTTTNLKQETLPTGAISSQLNFSLEPQGHLAISSIVEIPYEFSLNQATPLNQIYLGRIQQHPLSHTFDLMWRDRHSMAWTDINADQQLDIFIGRGGIKGEMGLFPEPFFDEIFVSRSDQKWVDEIEKANISKDHCPGRQSAWTDVDQDGLLDIYQICGRGSSDPKPYPNQLFRQTEPGRFQNIAAEVGLGLPRDGEFVWLDADEDGDPDLLATDGTQLSLYINDLTASGTFTHRVLTEITDANYQQFSVIDYDQDTDLDIYLATRDQAYLLNHTKDGLTVQNPKSLGLPQYSMCANWVDYDNDGLTDLYSFPKGLYRQQADHKFVKTGLLSEDLEIVGTPSSLLWGWKTRKLRDARCSWFDFDNDGDRDAVVAAETVPSFKDRMWSKVTGRTSEIQWQTKLIKNQQSPQHWLEVELKDQSQNPQAIGATVLLESSNGHQQFQQVGSAESSLFSQGHYRLYFGLGKDNQVKRLLIKWPNGEETQLDDIPGDEILTVTWPQLPSKS